MRFLHVISAILLVGLPIASYFYLTFTYSKERTNNPYTLKLSLLLDTVLIPLLFFVAATGLMLNIPLPILFHIPWVISSSLYLFFVMLGILLSLSLKLHSYLNFKKSGKVRLQTILHMICILQIILLIITMHDMVIKQPWPLIMT